MKGFKFGLTYSFAFTDQESDHASKNNRMLALGASYAYGPIGIYAGATQLWYGNDSNVADMADTAKAYDRENAQAYTLGVTWQATDSLKLFLASQYHSDWRSVAGWNADKDYAATADRINGIDGWSNMIGLQYAVTGQTRLLAKYIYFDGDHEMADGKEVDGSRHAVNAGVEQRLSKRTRLYAVLSYFKGEDALDRDNLNGFTGQFGLEHNF